jgi:hypothetical protein
MRKSVTLQFSKLQPISCKTLTKGCYTVLRIIHLKKTTYLAAFREGKILTLGCCEVGLGNALVQSSSFTRGGRVGSVGVRGWKLVGVGGSEAVEGGDSSSF